jgi:hypothetical protein
MCVSVTVEIGSGCASLPMAISSFALLYKPTVVMYGEKYEPVTKSTICPLFVLPEISVGFWEKLNSFWRMVHLYCASYKVTVDSNEHVMFDPVMNSVMKL